MTADPAPRPASRRTGGGSIGPALAELGPLGPRSGGAGNTSALDVLVGAPDGAARPLDALDALTADDTPNVTQDDLDDFTRLYELQQAKLRYAAMAETLGKDQSALQAELLQRRIDRGWDTLPVTTARDKSVVKPFIATQTWPKFRRDADDEKYTRDDVVQILLALAGDDTVPPEWGKLVKTDYDSKKLAQLMRKRIDEWAAAAGEDGVRNADGALVDAHDDPLVGDELDEPTAEILALPAPLRELIEISHVKIIGFSRG